MEQIFKHLLNAEGEYLKVPKNPRRPWRSLSSDSLWQTGNLLRLNFLILRAEGSNFYITAMLGEINEAICYVEGNQI